MRSDEREASSFCCQSCVNLPGVAVSRKGGVGSETFAYIRGGAHRTTRLKFYSDGLPVNDPGGAFDFGKLLARLFSMRSLSKLTRKRRCPATYARGALSRRRNSSNDLLARRAPDERKLFVNGEGGGLFIWNRRPGRNVRQDQDSVQTGTCSFIHRGLDVDGNASLAEQCFLTTRSRGFGGRATQRRHFVALHFSW